jgi:hypothetical protein
MKTTVKPGLRILFAALLGACLGAASAAAQANLEGTWKIERPRISLSADDRALPFTPQGRKRYEANRRAEAGGRYDFDLAQAFCASPGLPRLMLTPARLHIWQRPRIVTFQFEWNRLYVQVDTTGKPSEPPPVGLTIGVSKGQWEGDTLVVSTDNFNDQSLIDDAVPHSEDMTLTQRFRLLDPDHLEDRITVQDPQTFTRPWEATVTYKRQPDAPFPEDVCFDRRDAGMSPLPTK